MTDLSLTDHTLLLLLERPATLGREASAVRDRHFGTEVWLRPAPALGHGSPHALVRDDVSLPIERWPRAEALRPGDRLVLAVEPTGDGRTRWLTWLARTRKLGPTIPANLSIAPYSTEPAGVHPLWCIAAARLRLGAQARVEARHDLVGVRLAQVALAFGADTLAGPISQDRVLPLAGVPRPDETTRAGLQSLVQCAGLAVRPDPATTAPATLESR